MDPTELRKELKASVRRVIFLEGKEKAFQRKAIEVIKKFYLD